MKIFSKPIFTGFMPNLLPKEVGIALSFFLPWKWSKIQNGENIQASKNWLKQFFQVEHVSLWDSGRSGLYFALQALGVEKGDEVLVQAYTCSVVSNSILSTGVTPVYVDITDDFTLDPIDVQKKITQRSKVIIIQHTFGIPADLTDLLKIAKRHNLKVIEDCAHTIGSTYKGQKLGTFGDIGMLSFGADKPVSCGRGGALLTNNPTLAQFLSEQHSKLPFPPAGKTYQQLFTFILFYLCKPIYNLLIGKFFLALAKKLHVLSLIITPQEKRGEHLPFYPAKLPNALATVLLHQLQNLQHINQQRQKISLMYNEKINNKDITVPAAIQKNIDTAFFLRFPLLTIHPNKLHKFASQQGIMLGDWYNTVIAPKDVSAEKMGYQQGSCPRAEQLSSQSINLPTHIQLTPNDVKRVIDLINHYHQ